MAVYYKVKVICWPVEQTNPDRAEFPYYGPRTNDKNGNKCISPNYAYQILLSESKAVAADQVIFYFNLILTFLSN